MPSAKSIARSVLGVSFILAGLNHFRQRGFYIKIMPEYLPWHGPLVDISGYAEILLGALFALQRARRAAGWGLIALLVAVFPANVQMALHPQRYRRVPAWALWCRLPLQAVLIAWVDWCTRSSPPK